MRAYAARDEARGDVFAYVGGFDNRRCLHSGLGYRFPAEVERRTHSVA